MKLPALAVFLVAVYSCRGQQFGAVTARELGLLLSDRGYVLQQIGCVLGRAQCDLIGNQLKIAIPEVLVRNCQACSPQQAENARNVIQFLRTNYPNEWSEIQRRYSQNAPRGF